MNRNIIYKFRGIPQFGTDFVYGSLEEHWGEGCKKLYDIRNNDSGLTIYRVKKESVGQFTGEFDKNKKQIYQGDIIRLNSDDKEIYNVEFTMGCFVLINEDSWIAFNLIKSRQLEVINYALSEKADE